MAAWTNFAFKGSPNRAGNSSWPQFSSSNGSMLSENVPSSSTMSASQFSANFRAGPRPLLWNVHPRATLLLPLLSGAGVLTLTGKPPRVASV
ncbi:MAG: carboxylesterase family protein [Solirubrobacterales bacterium]|nr:carboxylesterase family protein [Solirubrobacterales bacterium]MBV9944534.1 carboxylesterase family protein [Solirubrobacterales bacterium]